MEARRQFENKVLDFVLPSPSRDSVLVGLVNLSGSVPHKTRKVNGGTIGTMHVLRLYVQGICIISAHNYHVIQARSGSRRQLGHCSYNVRRSEDMPCWCVPVIPDGVFCSNNLSVPTNIAYSPNRAVLCSIASSSFLDHRISIHALPRRRHYDYQSLNDAHVAHLSTLLVSAIRSRNSPSDVIHILSSPALSVDTAVDTMCHALAMLNKESTGLSEIWIAEVLGVATEVYRYVSSAVRYHRS